MSCGTFAHPRRLSVAACLSPSFLPFTSGVNEIVFSTPFILYSYVLIRWWWPRTACLCVCNGVCNPLTNPTTILLTRH
uniref:Putative secreted peptide n=1 Tax=Anopheles braziliensis TaxID=58242 RepID=A0A2M3ZXP5_9DIPT